MRWNLFLIVTLFSIISIAAPNAYMISAQFFINDKLVSSPRIITLAGEPSEISQVGEKPHSNELQKFRMKVVATEMNNETIQDGVLMKFEIEANTSSYKFKTTPQVLTKVGSEATILVSDTPINKEKLFMKVIATRQ